MTALDTVAESPASAPSRRLARRSLGLAVFLVVATVLLVQAHDRRPAPYAYDDLGITSTVQVVAHNGVAAELQRLEAPAGVPAPLGLPGPFLVGQLRYAVPMGADGVTAWLLVTDRATHRSTQSVYGEGPRPGANGRGWSSTWNGLATRYDWLSGVGERTTDVGVTSDAEALSLPAQGPLTFVAQLPDGARTVDDVELTVFLERDGRPVWAHGSERRPTGVSGRPAPSWRWGRPRRPPCAGWCAAPDRPRAGSPPASTARCGSGAAGAPGAAADRARGAARSPCG